VLAGLAGALAAAAPAFAQERAGEPAADGNIVVTGRPEAPPTAREITRQARSITAQSGLRESPLPRFEDRLCPGIIGMKADYASLMIDRIRANAERLDMWLTEDDGRCTPNFIVAFVRDGQAELAALEDEKGYLFRSLPLHERRELLAEDGPVRVWTTTQTKTRDGIPVQRGQGGNPPTASMWMAHSKIYVGTREDIVSVVVLFDMADAQGKTLLQLADYATMRGLARTRPTEDGQALDSILALFDADGSPPLQMTDFDRAYLAAVYDDIPNIPGITKVQGVNRQLRLQAQAEAGAPATRE